MFDATKHRPIFHRTRGKEFAIVRINPTPVVVSYTSAINPRVRFMRVIRSRDIDMEFAIVRLKDMATTAYYPPMKERAPCHQPIDQTTTPNR